MKKDMDKTREEKLLEAIGNLPEDMIAKAAEYSPWQKNEEEQGDSLKEAKREFFDDSLEQKIEKEESKKEGWFRGNLYFLYRGLAVAACLAVVIFAGSTGGKMLRNYLGEDVDTSIESGTVSEYASGNITDSSEEFKTELDSESSDGNSKVEEPEKESVKGNGGEDAIGDGVSDAELCFFTNANWYQGTGEENTDIIGDFSESESVSSGIEVFEEGRTISLQVLQTKSEVGEDIQVLALGFKGGEKGVKYSLHSEVGNCKIIAITNDEERKYINLSDAEFVDGDVIEIGTKQIACASWVSGIVPEWEKKGIGIFDILDISSYAEEGEGEDLGRIIIGENEGEFYGIYQKAKK